MYLSLLTFGLEKVSLSNVLLNLFIPISSQIEYNDSFLLFKR